MAVAVGPNHVVQAVNEAVTVFDKVGNTQPGFPVTIDSFFGLPANAFTFDPRALYDAANDRFIVIADRADFANSLGFIELAASATNDPTGPWNTYEIQSSPAGTCADFPTLGQDHNNWIGEPTGGIYVAFNEFRCSPSGFGAFVDAKVFLLPKTPIYAGAGFGFWFQFGFNSGGTLIDTLQPANVMDTPDHPRAEFMVNSRNILFNNQCSIAPCNGLIVWAISNPFGFLLGGPSPEFSGVNLATPSSYRLPPNAHQQGTGFLIDTGDVRISGSSAYKAGSLWASLNTGFQGTVEGSFLWWEIHPTLNDNNARCGGGFTNACPDITTAVIRNEKCYFCFGGIRGNGSAYYATVQPDPEGNTTVVFNFSSDVDFGSTAYLSDRVTQAVNTFHDGGIFLASGVASYFQGRWGDYTGVSADLSTPNQPMMWFSGMWAMPGNSWGTAIGGNGFTDPTQP